MVGRIFLSFRLNALLIGFAVIVWTLLNSAQAGNLDQGFAAPPLSARPRVYWYWMNGNYTKEGVTLDLEAMKRIGLGGAMIMEVTCGIPEGSVRTGTAEWWELIRHTLTEADRLGLQIAFGNGTGWSGSQGPWVTPEDAMQHLVSSETRVQGPQKFKGILPQPYTRYGFYRDIDVFAVPAGNSEPIGAVPTVTTSHAGKKIRLNDAHDSSRGDLPLLPDSLDVLTDGDPDTVVRITKPKGGEPICINVEYSEPVTASCLRIFPAYWQNHKGEILVSSDGVNYEKLRDFSLPNQGPTGRAQITFTFEPTRSRWFRVAFTSDPLRTAKWNGCVEIGEISLGSGARVDVWEVGSGLIGGSPAATFKAIAKTDVVKTGDVIALKSLMNDKGELQWDVPEGDWYIIRMGHTTLNVPYDTPPRWAQGLEVDKFNRGALQRHWDSYMGKIVDVAGPLAGKALWATHTDSWECGTQNWTPGFEKEFENRRGYSMLSYLPALTGRIVESAETTHRFFWDLRRTHADLIAENYFGGLADLARKHGLLFTTEAYGNANMDAYQCAGRADIPMTEIWTREWNRTPEDCMYIKWGASPAHVYGKRIVGCEAFSTSPDKERGIGAWLDHPYSLKALGDNFIFCGGVNLLSIHVYGQQPWKDLEPGMTVGGWGLDFNRNQTWWNYSTAWIDYLSRCSFLLQQGLFVADALYFYGEDPKNHPKDHRNALCPALPKGHDWDSCPSEALLHRVDVKDGRLVLPDGMSYAYLIVNHGEPMSLPVVEKIRDLVKAGATVVGPKPKARTPGLAGYPESETRVAGILDKVWGNLDGKAVKECVYGKGRVVWDAGGRLADIFDRDNLAADFSYKAGTNVVLNYIHRRTDKEDIYFVANYRYEPAEAELTFRVSGKRPEFWHADMGKIEPVNDWREENGCTVIPYRFDPAGSAFVVFRGKEARGKRQEGREKNFLELKSVMELTGAWEVQFDPTWFYPDNGTGGKLQFDKLDDWSTRTEEAIKYYSGTAVYRKVFDLPEPRTLNSGSRLFLDLGKLAIIAEVKLNGQELGVLWKQSFRADITDVVKSGRNELEIKVANQWANRMIGDELVPDDELAWRSQRLEKWPAWLLNGTERKSKRAAFASWKHWTKDDQLRESGLLGPVRLMTTDN